MNKRVAIIILNWNGRELLKRFLPSVVSHSPEWAEVIVADNGSTDDSIDLLRTEFPSVRLILLDRNYGFAEGYNRAIAQIDHEYCVLLNSDIEVTPGWMEAPVRLLDSDPALAGAQPKIRSWRDKKYFEYAGAAGGYMDLSIRYPRGHLMGYGRMPLHPDHRLQGSRRAGRGIFRPSRRNRPLLAPTLPGLSAGLRASIRRLSRRRGDARCRESPQDVPELPQQPLDAL